MSWIATAIVGGAVVSGYFGNKSADRQADAIEDSADRATEESRRQFDLVREDTAPYREAGERSLNTLKAMAEGRYFDFTKSPDYEFRQEEGQKAVDRSLVARTGGLGGRAVKEGVRYASNLAKGEFADFWNRVASQAGIGQTAVGQSGAAGGQSAGQVGNAMITAGIGRGNAEQYRGESLNNAVQGGISNYMLRDYLRPPAGGAARPTSSASTLNTWRSR